MVANVFMLLLTVSEQKSKVGLISELQYLALGQIRKLGNLEKIFLSFRNFLNFLELLGKICVTISDDRSE